MSTDSPAVLAFVMAFTSAVIGGSDLQASMRT